MVLPSNMHGQLGPAPPIVTLTTDFGDSAAFAGIMKGVVLTRAPHARLIDLTHSIRPQAVLEGAFVFEPAWRHFPAGSVHLVVIDPGVGGARRRIALAAGGHLFVGPDNGCLSGVLPPSMRGRRALGEAYEPRSIALPPEVVAVTIDNPLMLARKISATFEGRDVFAPAAGYLASGGLIVDLGRRIDSMLAFPEFRAPVTEGRVEGIVLMADHFGNVLTDVRAADVPGSTELLVSGRPLPIVRTYSDATGPCAIEGSTGYLEIALPNGNAAGELRLRTGERVSIARAG